MLAKAHAARPFMSLKQCEQLRIKEIIKTDNTNKISVTDSKNAHQGYLKPPLHKSNEKTGEIVRTNRF